MPAASSPPPAPLHAELADGLKRGVLLAAALCTLALPPPGLASRVGASAPATVVATLPADAAPAETLAPAAPAPAALPAPPRFAAFGAYKPTADVRFLADWVLDAGDADGQPFVVIDKRDARVYVFEADGRLQAASPVLLGFAAGDDSVPGIGERPIAQVRPSERTTPAGRFVGERGTNAGGEDVVWVDYDAAVSMHRVRPTNPAERRLERLATPTPADNRISYGCINVPVAFFEQFVAPLFARQRAPVYVLPETRPLQAVFAAYDVARRHDGAAPAVASAEHRTAATPAR